MKYLIPILLILSGCGYQYRGTEAIGQVKRVTKSTPLICPDQTELDLSLGIMRNGTGSMSTQDMFLRVMDDEQEETLKKAAEAGSPVKITYDVKRVTWCMNDHEITSVEILK